MFSEGFQVSKKTILKLLLILPVALGALLYGGGYIAQFLYNYGVWQTAGGTFGTAPEFPDSGFFACIRSVFRWPYGLYGVGGCVAALAVLIFMVMRMRYAVLFSNDKLPGITGSSAACLLPLVVNDQIFFVDTGARFDRAILHN